MNALINVITRTDDGELYWPGYCADRTMYVKPNLPNDFSLDLNRLIVLILEFAEEYAACHRVVICLDRTDMAYLKTFLCAGFVMIPSSKSRFIQLGCQV